MADSFVAIANHRDTETKHATQLIGGKHYPMVILAGTSGAPSSSSNVKNDILNASDTTETWSYFDAGTADERVSTIVFSSVVVGSSATLTITYAGVSGFYRVATRTWS